MNYDGNKMLKMCVYIKNSCSKIHFLVLLMVVFWIIDNMKLFSKHFTLALLKTLQFFSFHLIRCLY
jgi:hypothetical protein